MKIFENDLTIDLDKLIDSRAIICANSGGGKSYTARKILEESHGKVMCIVLDTEGEFKSLREKYDFLLIGGGGDVDLNPNSASLLPKKLLELNVPTIIDISELKKRERETYIKNFLEALMEVPKELWKACLIFLDEIHTLAGQQEKQVSTYAVIDVATRGRKRGFALIGLTQRISKLHKDVVAELNNYLVGRTSLDLDMKRSADILGFASKQDMLSLRDLKDGEFYVFGPAISKEVNRVQVAKSKTTHPKRGSISKVELSPPTEKIKGILSSLNDLPHQAKKELKEVNDYKIEISNLKREIITLKKGKVGPPALDEKSLEKARIGGFNECKKKMQEEIDFLRKENTLLIKRDQSIAKILNVPLPPRPEYKPVEITPNVTVNTDMSNKPVTKPKQIIEESDDDIKLGLSEKKIYSLLAQYPEREFTKQQIGAFTGYRYGSGSFSNAVGRLNTLGLIIKKGNSLQAKEVREDLMEEFNFSKEAMVSKLGKCEREIYEVLLNNPYSEYTKENLAEETPSKYSAGSGSFGNALGRLNTFGLISKENGLIKLNPELLELEQ